MTSAKVRQILICLFAAIGLTQCNSSENSIVRPRPDQTWKPALSSEQIAAVQQTFPMFEPELFASNTNPMDRANLNPGNFSPARFFGPGVSNGTIQTSTGVSLQPNGFDSLPQPETLSPAGTYYDPTGRPIPLTFGQVRLVPLNVLEARMGLNPTPNAPSIEFSRRATRIHQVEIDQVIQLVKNSLALRLPEVTNVDPSSCEVVIEPTIFYSTHTNFGSVWVGGLTEPLGMRRYRLHVELFYVHADGRISGWREFLQEEAINCFVLAVGRPDLAR